MEPTDTGSYFALVADLRGRRQGRGRRGDPEAGPGSRARQGRRLVAARRSSTTARASSIRPWSRSSGSPRSSPRTRRTTTRWRCSSRRRSARTSPSSPAVEADYLDQGHRGVDKALELTADYFEALTYKNLLLRQQARRREEPGQAAGADPAGRRVSRRRRSTCGTCRPRAPRRGCRTEEIAGRTPRLGAALVSGRFCPRVESGRSRFRRSVRGLQHAGAAASAIATTAGCLIRRS